MLDVIYEGSMRILRLSWGFQGVQGLHGVPEDLEGPKVFLIFMLYITALLIIPDAWYHIRLSSNDVMTHYLITSTQHEYCGNKHGQRMKVSVAYNQYYNWEFRHQYNQTTSINPTLSYRFDQLTCKRIKVFNQNIGVFSSQSWYHSCPYMQELTENQPLQE